MEHRSFLLAHCTDRHTCEHSVKPGSGLSSAQQRAPSSQQTPSSQQLRASRQHACGGAQQSSSATQHEGCRQHSNSSSQHRAPGTQQSDGLDGEPTRGCPGEAHASAATTKPNERHEANALFFNMTVLRYAGPCHGRVFVGAHRDRPDSKQIQKTRFDGLISSAKRTGANEWAARRPRSAVRRRRMSAAPESPEERPDPDGHRSRLAGHPKKRRRLFRRSGIRRVQVSKAEFAQRPPDRGPNSSRRVSAKSEPAMSAPAMSAWGRQSIHNKWMVHQ